MVRWTLSLAIGLMMSFNIWGIDYQKVQVGAERIDLYLPMLQGKKVAVIANHTSFVGTTHLVDTLLSLDVELVKIFAPEHGFRGLADAGSHIKNGVDTKTGLPLISLYGKHKKPSAEQLKGIDLVIFDIQDVGVRFYTYISTMHLAMEACAENHIPFLVLDRPNPNGFYVDGAILEGDYRSFIGMHNIPIVHGLTVGELAKMINGEKWLKNKVVCDLTVIPCLDYTHKTWYQLPIKPSPNLPNMKSVFYYPTLGLLEGTAVSIGRGTKIPFQCVAHPLYKGGDFKVVPQSMSGAKYPKWENKQCTGFALSDKDMEALIAQKQIDIDLLLDVYARVPHEKFFRSSFTKLSGTKRLKEQLKNGTDAQSIRASWQKGLADYKVMRKKYLLYEDFE